jgi:hypothetical protein
VSADRLAADSSQHGSSGRTEPELARSVPACPTAVTVHAVTGTGPRALLFQLTLPGTAFDQVKRRACPGR